MKKKLLAHITIALSLTIITVSAVLGFHSTHVARSFTQQTIENILKSVTFNIKFVETLLMVVDDNLKSVASEELFELGSMLEPSLASDSITDDELKRAKLKLSANEIYIIDRNYTITHTTLPSDKNLSFKGVTEFTSFLDKIYGADSIFSHRPTASYSTGKFNSYYYYSPPNSDYIIEISFAVREYLITRYSMDFFTTSIKHVAEQESPSPFINQIDVISYNKDHSWSFFTEGLNRKDLNEEILSSLPQDKTYTEKRGRNYILYHNIGSTLSSKISRDKLFVIIEYNLDIINSTIIHIVFITIVVAAIALAGTLVFFTSLINRSVLERINLITRKVKELPLEGFGKEITIPGNDELNDITDSVNNMSVKILDREHQLNRLKNYLTDIIDSIQSLVIVIDRSFNISLINKAACNHLNIDYDTAFGTNIFQIIPELKKYEEEMSRLNVTGKSMHYKERTTFTRFQICNISITSMSHENDENIIIKVDDISEVEQKDEQLLQAQKMEVIGTLAGGFAHNLNNVLSGVVGSVSLLKHRLKTYTGKDRDFFDETVSIISSSAEKAIDMSKELLSISKKRQAEYGSVSLDEAINNVIKMCTHIFDKNVTINYTNTESEPLIFGNESQIEHLLLNIFVNAYHAMTIMRTDPDKQGGTVTVLLTKALDDSFLKKTFNRIDRDYWEISISDTGVGIPDDIREQIFDPFFSTKPSKGTGLGLATVYSIIKQHDGAITVTSNKDEGAVFTLYFPNLHNQPLPKKIEQVRKDKNLLREGQGKILIIDDEPFVRKTAQTILSSAGYTVSIANSGFEGITMFQAIPDFDIIILDMIMPGMSGKDTFHELKKLDPDVKVIISSGFVNESVLDELQQLGAAGYIRKPYSAVDLANIVYSRIYGETE